MTRDSRDSFQITVSLSRFKGNLAENRSLVRRWFVVGSFVRRTSAAKVQDLS